MKKIIYSFVIMIAAGSLFTSCVTNTEPQGIKDIRQAKADYIESLSKLNAANEKLVAAEAAYKEAETAVKAAEVAVVEAQAAQAQAQAAQEQARVEIIKAQAEAMKIANDKAVAELNHQLAMDSLEFVKALIAIAQTEQINALAIEARKADLAKQLAMDSAEIMSMFLDIAAKEAQNAYNDEVNKAALEDYKAKVEANIRYYESLIAGYEADIRDAEDRIAKAEAQAQKDALDLEKALLDKEAELIKAQKALAEQEAEYLAYLAKVELESYKLTTTEQAAVTEYKEAYSAVIAAKQWVRKVEELCFKNETGIEKKYADSLAKLQNAVTRESKHVEFYKEQIANVEASLASLPDSGKTAEEVAALRAEYAKQIKELEYKLANIKNEYKLYKQTELGEPVIAYTTELSKWIVDNAALPAPFDMHFKAELPDNGAVSALFANCISGISGVAAQIDEKTEKAYFIANFETSVAALAGIAKIDSVIDAISRKYIIDNVGLEIDTVGLKDAVAAAEAEYKAIADTLKNGLTKYAAVVDAQDSIAKAVADTATAFEAHKVAVKDTVKKYKIKVKADTALLVVKDTLDKLLVNPDYFSQAKADSVAWKGHYDYWAGEAEKAEAKKDQTAHERDSLVDLSENLDSRIEQAEEDEAVAKVRKENAELKKVAAVEKFNHAQDSLNTLVHEADTETDPIKKDSLLALIPGVQEYVASAKADTVSAHKALTQAKTAYDNVKTLLADLKAIDKTVLAQKIATAKATFATDSTDFAVKDSTAKVRKVQLDSAAAVYAQVVADTLKFTEAKAQAEKDTAKFNKQYRKSIAAEAKAAEDTVAALTFLERAVNDIYPAAVKSFYTNIYCKFWGITYNKSLFNGNKPTKFLKDSIPYNDFTEVFKGEGLRKVLKFKPTYQYSKANGFTGSYTIVDNAETEIILARLKDDYKVVHFDATLLCQLFAKQQSADDIFAAVGTINNDEALAALTKIKDALNAEFVAAGEKQEAASEPFYTFIKGLVGEEFITTVYDRIDAAIVKYSEFIKAGVNPQGLDLLAQAVAKGDVTSKQVFTFWFETILSGNGSYRDKYVNLQVAGAFAGEEFKQLVADVLAAKIEKNSGLKVSGTLEEVLFNVIDLSNVNLPDFTGSLLNVLTNSTVATYIVKDFGGKIAELQEKHLAGWKEVWTAYQADSTAVKTEIDDYEALDKVIEDYSNDDAIKDLITKEWLSKNFIGSMKWQLSLAEKAVAEAQKALDAFVAGPDIYEQHKTEHLADVLAKALNDLSIAEQRLERATAAYNKVIESHSIAE